MKNILFIGAGNMGRAIIKGILGQKLMTSADISFFEPNQELSCELEESLGIKAIATIDESIKEFDAVVLAIKPQIFKGFQADELMSKLFTLVSEQQTVISIMAGIDIATMSSYFKGAPGIIRVMPNTPALVGEAMSVVSPAPAVADEIVLAVDKIFSSIGSCRVLPESYIDAVTGLSGSGPAYVFMFIESLIQGGILSGLSYDVAKELAVQTVLGSVKMVAESDRTIEELRHQVTSPGGTTIAAINHMEKNAFRAAVSGAVKASADRAKELSAK